MNKISAIETYILRIPTIRAHSMSVATMREQRLVVIVVRDSDGGEGFGEATTIGGLRYVDESPEGIALAIEKYVAPVLIGEPANSPAQLMARLRGAIVGNYFALCAVETALLDLQGKRLGLPLSELLGGRLVSALPVAWTLASGDTDKDIAEARDLLQKKRHNIFKLKIGMQNWRDDVRHVGAIADAVGDKASIRVDINQAWDFATARIAVPALHDVGVELVEQPLAITDRHGMAELRRVGGPAIMLDESLRGGPDTAFAAARDRICDVFALKIGQAGGLWRARDVAQIANAAGIALYGGTMLEGTIGSVAAAHLFATLPKMAWGTELFGPLLLTDEITTEPLRYADFTLHLPDKPGLGVALDWDKVAHYREGQSG